jgi:hypothetical protein
MGRLNRPKSLAAQHREAMAERCLGENRECVDCGETRVFALERKSDPRLCTESRKRMEGKTTMEKHHIFSRANSEITISISANDHRADLSESQKEWPEQTLRNPDGSPLLRAAAFVRGFVDTLLYLAEKFLLWAAEMLERLNAHLIAKYGPKWWLDMGIEGFQERVRKTNGQ